jgi:hypothetical protein
MTGLGLDHLIDDSIIHCFFWSHEKVAIAVIFHLLLGLAGILTNVGIEHFPNEQDFLGLDLDISGLALSTCK